MTVVFSENGTPMLPEHLTLLLAGILPDALCPRESGGVIVVDLGGQYWDGRETPRFGDFAE